MKKESKKETSEKKIVNIVNINGNVFSSLAHPDYIEYKYGIRFITDVETNHYYSFSTYEIVDEKKFILAKIRYGI